MAVLLPSGREVAWHKLGPSGHELHQAILNVGPGCSRGRQFQGDIVLYACALSVCKIARRDTCALEICVVLSVGQSILAATSEGDTRKLP